MPQEPESYGYFGYQVNSRLATTNAGTSFGDATSAGLLSTRLYPGLFVPGPSGELIPNADLVETEELPPVAGSDQRSVQLTLEEDAVFSDGAPVTCDDYLLAYVAGTHPAEFASHMPLMNDIADFNCEPHGKRFTLTFNKDQGQRWRHMFGAGTIMPAHALAKKPGLSVKELNAALTVEDMQALAPVAEEWRYGFSVDKDQLDPELQVSFGPYVIDKVGDEGEIILKANEKYFGDAPAEEHVVVWPSDADAQKLADKGALRVVDAASENPDWLDSTKDESGESPYEVTPMVGELTDTLTLSEAGIFAEPWARESFAACVDQQAVAQASSAASGVEVPPAYLRTVSVTNPVAGGLDKVGKQHQGTDLAKAGDLNGTTIKVGYLGPDKRYAAMVEQLRASCEPAGITIEDASAEFMSQHYLEMDPETWAPTVDAFLGPVDPQTEYSTVESSMKNSAELKKTEEALWKDVPSIPLSAQPRVFLVHRDVEGVLPYTGVSGIGWNMDRWHSTVPTDKE
ncbi:MAG: ABC transporter substrate-binding protein [Corynebacterium sp.]|uniref:ABC transporter substrate-binding protein n=1 Tax=unclassified Corynebacterium TaxID=2624378 RepID=UPI000ACE1899|nr:MULTISPECIES: ABC transporter substrate-binding protein [unclassified Corynebacterium]MDU1463278.1 ABC transporter substrate-binding protein [Corynebacterium sp.]MDU7102096.1 ABC transporter substrate-binding protein [Corynebacterium sp.]